VQFFTYQTIIKAFQYMKKFSFYQEVLIVAKIFSCHAMTLGPGYLGTRHDSGSQYSREISLDILWENCYNAGDPKNARVIDGVILFRQESP